jgi:Na+-transporting NADH:ubiquinone oxidoreductase subunit NqrB
MHICFSRKFLCTRHDPKTGFGLRSEYEYVYVLFVKFWLSCSSFEYMFYGNFIFFPIMLFIRIFMHFCEVLF